MTPACCVAHCGGLQSWLAAEIRGASVSSGHSHSRRNTGLLKGAAFTGDSDRQTDVTGGQSFLVGSGAHELHIRAGVLKDTGTLQITSPYSSIYRPRKDKVAFEQITDLKDVGEPVGFRSARLGVGEIALVKSENGFWTALQLVETGVGGRFSIAYRIQPDGSANFGAKSANDADLERATESAIEALATLLAEVQGHDVEPDDSSRDFGVGHNEPPPEYALTSADLDALGAILSELSDRREEENLHASFVERALAMLSRSVLRITAWSKARIAWTEEGLYKGIGAAWGVAALASIARWLDAAAKLQAVVDWLRTLSQSLLG